MPQSRARAVFAAAGFASPDALVPGDTLAAYYIGEAEARDEIERVRWPKFVVNDALEVVAANRAAIGLWDFEVDFEVSGRTRAQLSLLAILADPRVASHVANLDACFGSAVGILKAALEKRLPTTDAAIFAEAVLAECAARDPSTIRRLLRIWEATPATTPRAQATYDVVWRDGQGVEIGLMAVTSVCNEPDGLFYHDWYPVDAASHAGLERILEAWRSRSETATGHGAPSGGRSRDAAQGRAPGRNAGAWSRARR